MGVFECGGQALVQGEGKVGSAGRRQQVAGLEHGVRQHSEQRGHDENQTCREKLNGAN